MQFLHDTSRPFYTTTRDVAVLSYLDDFHVAILINPASIFTKLLHEVIKPFLYLFSWSDFGSKIGATLIKLDILLTSSRNIFFLCSLFRISGIWITLTEPGMTPLVYTSLLMPSTISSSLLLEALSNFCRERNTERQLSKHQPAMEDNSDH